MSKKVEFSFGDDSIAKSYDKILVPALFEPWAFHLIENNKPWVGKVVLDLACGTGVVTKELARNVGSNGRITALDINSQMLDIAYSKCKEWGNQIDFIEGSCESLAIADSSVDIVVCQQGLQFFPNKQTAVLEIYRVLRPGGRVIISTWCPVSECEIFGAICETLEALNENELSQMMRVPFDFMTEIELEEPFNIAGFSNIEVSKLELNMNLNGEIDSALMIAYATPIAPKLKELSIEKREEFNRLFTAKMRLISQDEKNCGKMVSNILKANK
jgi:ubiquinone/menaquinone biosynthesis C-methylase UbiE